MLVAQDLASYGRDQGRGERAHRAAGRGGRRAGRPGPPALPVPLRPRPTRLIDAICATGVPYFDLSLQHVSPPLLRRMRRWGDGDRFLAPHRRHPRAASPTPPSAPTSSSATRARPRPTTTGCSRFVEEAQLDWCGFFAFSARGGHLRRRPRRRGRRRPGRGAPGRAARAAGRASPPPAGTALIGTEVEVLVDEPGVGPHATARRPRSTAIVEVPTTCAPGTFATVEVVGAAAGPDLVGGAGPSRRLAARPEPGRRLRPAVARTVPYDASARLTPGQRRHHRPAAGLARPDRR